MYHKRHRDAEGELEGYSGYHRGVTGALGLRGGGGVGGGVVAGYSSGGRGTLGVLQRYEGYASGTPWVLAGYSMGTPWVCKRY